MSLLRSFVGGRFVEGEKPHDTLYNPATEDSVAEASARARLCYLSLIAEHQLGIAPNLEERLAAARTQFALLTRA